MRWIKTKFNLSKFLFFPFMILIIVIQMKVIFTNLGDIIEKQDVEKIEKYLKINKNQI